MAYPQTDRKHDPRIVIPVDDDFKEKVAVAVIRYRMGTTARFGREAFEHYIRHLEKESEPIKTEAA
ncbi:MAG: hypothetical protein HC781_01655 [Leptolyngbyaceae cyanobacterium CSU_1_4]|nr:hypothetical protein [Leptolyngbyaceae cyanobacterium CSU_1_4]